MFSRIKKTKKIDSLELKLLQNAVKCRGDSVIKDFENTLNIWNTRNLTINGKNCIAKSLALSKLVHLFSSLPDPPENVFTKLQRIYFQFLWSGKAEKIKRDTMYNSYEQGGFKVTNIRYFCMARQMLTHSTLIQSTITQMFLESRFVSAGMDLSVKSNFNSIHSSIAR